MGKVESITLEGLTMWFWSGDHEPPHFHAKKAGEWEIKIYFLEIAPDCLTYEIKWGKGPGGRTQARLAALIVPKLEALLQEWETKTQTETS